MTDETRSLPPDASRDQRLEGVLAEYLRRVEAGEEVDRQALLAAHPDLAPELREFFANRAHLERIVGKPPAAHAATTAEARKIRYFGDYELLDEIAHGGMGIVYKGRQVSLNRPVAVKMILAGQLAGDADVKRFRAEAEAAANLRHPGVVPIYEVGIHEGQHYFSMEYVEGQTLSQVVRESSLSATKAAEYVREMAEIVEYAHQQGVLHRDLKPSNVLIDADDRVRITDFGLAKRIAGGSDLTITGQVIGTPSYMPPEQAAAQHAIIGATSDVYALGAILYELLTGRAPFRSENIAETLRQVQQDDPVRPRLLSPRLPRDLETICLKCLEKEPRRRYATAQQLADELGRFLRGEPIHARPIRLWQRGLKWARRRPAVAGLLLSLAVVVIAALFTVTMLWMRSESNLAARNIALARYEWSANRLDEARALLKECPAVHRDAEWQYLWRACNSQLAVMGNGSYPLGPVVFSPDGTMVAAGVLESRNSPGARAWHIASRAELDLRGGSFKALALAFHFNEHLVAVTQSYGKSRVIKADIRDWQRPLLFEDQHPNLDTVFAVSPNATVVVGNVKHERNADGRIILGAQPPLKVVALETNIEIATLEQFPEGIDTFPSVVVPHLAFNADGKRLAAIFDDESLVVWDVKTGRSIGRRTRVDVGSCPCISPDGRKVAFASHLRWASGSFIHLWDLESGEATVVVRESPGLITTLAFHPNGKWLAVNGENAVTIWDVTNGEALLTLRGHTGQVRGLAFSPDGTRLASASDDGTVRIWNVKLDP